MSAYLTRLRARRAALQQRALDTPSAQVPYVCPRCDSFSIAWVGGAEQTPICNDCRCHPPVIAVLVTILIADIDRAIAWAKSSEVPA